MLTITYTMTEEQYYKVLDAAARLAPLAQWLKEEHPRLTEFADKNVNIATDALEALHSIKPAINTSRAA